MGTEPLTWEYTPCGRDFWDAYMKGISVGDGASCWRVVAMRLSEPGR